MAKLPTCLAMLQICLAMLGLSAGSAVGAECNGLSSCVYQHQGSATACHAISHDPEPGCGFFCEGIGMVLNQNCSLPNDDPWFCDEEDVSLKHWTFLRYATLNAIMLYRVSAIIKQSHQTPEAEPFCLHPRLTQKMVDGSKQGGITGLVRAVFFAGLIFIQSEGVGFVIYFVTSAVLDNFTIFIASLGHDYCEWVTVVALYTAALVTFLPNCVLAYKLQNRMYDRGDLRMKIGFVLIMLITTGLFFAFRLYVVYDLGWAAQVHYIFGDLKKGTHEFRFQRVLAAVLMPPAVDLIQTLLLILASLKAKDGKGRQENGNKVDLEYKILA